MVDLLLPNRSVVHPNAQKEAAERQLAQVKDAMFIGSLQGMGLKVLEEDRVYPIIDAAFSSADDFLGIESLLETLKKLAESDGEEVDHGDAAEGVAGLILLALLRLSAKQEWEVGKAALTLHRASKEKAPE